MLDKKGVSAVVATVLIVMITVAGVAIVWTSFISVIRENAESLSEGTVNLEIVIDKGYTVWDGENKRVNLQIKRGQDSLVLEGYQVVFFDEERAHQVLINLSLFPHLIPGPGQTIVGGFQLPADFGKPTNIRIAPIVEGKLLKVTSELSIALSGEIKDAANPILDEDVDVGEDGRVYDGGSMGPEICDNGIDDDADGDIDCLGSVDNDCYIGSYGGCFNY